MNYEAVQEVMTALEREKVQYVEFGAVAINLLGLARAREDLDIFVAPDRENIERLKSALRSVFDDPSIEEVFQMSPEFPKPIGAVFRRSFLRSRPRTASWRKRSDSESEGPLWLAPRGALG